MTESEEVRPQVKQGTLFVNHKALNTWLRFGTLTSLEDENGYRRSEGTELLRWARLRTRSLKSARQTKKE